MAIDNTMILNDLKPEWEKRGDGTYLAFDCPKCKGHRISIPVPPTPKAWDIVGKDFAELSTWPSIAHDNGQGCKSHFFIKGGEIIEA